MMPKNDNAHSLRFIESLRKNTDENISNDFAMRYPLSKSADIEKKFIWAMNVCEYLERNRTGDEIMSIRKDCRCNDGKTIADKMYKYIKRTSSVKEFIAMFNQNESFAKLEYISQNKLLFIYPECYCACVKRIPKEISRTWCYCTLGNAEGIFERVFMKEVRVELIESIKSGDSRCSISVEW